MYCGHCGEPTSLVELVELVETDHTLCELQLVMEPPRYCPSCRRRLKVQVAPRGWTAECVEHGTFAG